MLQLMKTAEGDFVKHSSDRKDLELQDIYSQQASEHYAITQLEKPRPDTLNQKRKKAWKA